MARPVHIPSGWVIPLPLALPNLVWALWPAPGLTAKAAAARGPLSLIEAAGRGLVFCMPFFLEFQFTAATYLILLTVAGLALVLYYSPIRTVRTTGVRCFPLCCTLPLTLALKVVASRLLAVRTTSGKGKR